MKAQPKRSNRTLLQVSGVAVVAAALWIGLRGDDKSDQPNEPAGPKGSVKPSASHKQRPAFKPKETGVRRANAPSLSASPEVDAIIGNQEIGHDEAALQLADMVLESNRPIAERIEAMEHVVILTDSEHPEPILKVAASPKLPDPLVSLIVSESYNHSDRLQGEILLLLLGNESRSTRKLATIELGKLTQESHGENASAWRNAVSQLED